MRAECDIARQAGAEAEMGFLHVRSGWQRVHFAPGNAGNCDGNFASTMLMLATMLIVPFPRAGYLQNGWLGDEDAGGREHAREADGQDLPPDGPQQGRQTESGGVHRGGQE